ncbi:ATP-binding protein [Dulcicalothrix desertica]|uniref:ATP-binding protein n=1 Tax=Dulcicalothrix desertica TaxID=32056 RepID=UPI001646CCCF|nr:ATP-binding protein [Dulcicalothrix desertica]
MYKSVLERYLYIQKRLAQLLINLLGNAIKFTDVDSVTLHIDVNHFSAENIVLHLFIKDTGVGMSVVQLDKIFTPLQQVGDTQRHVQIFSVWR